jgi:hypothetical protein
MKKSSGEQGRPGARWVGSERLGEAPPVTKTLSDAKRSQALLGTMRKQIPWSVPILFLWSASNTVGAEGEDVTHAVGRRNVSIGTKRNSPPRRCDVGN